MNRRPILCHSGAILWDRCRRGLEPAESLDWRDRECLVAELVTSGWTDVDIACHTRMTTYTTARIRGRLGLLPNWPSLKGAAA